MFGFATFDVQTTVTQWSDELHALTGLSAQDAIGHSLIDLFPSLLEHAGEAAIRNVFETGLPYPFSYAAAPSSAGFPSPYQGRIERLTQAGQTTGLLLILQGDEPQPPSEELHSHLLLVKTLSKVHQAAISGDLALALHTVVDEVPILLSGATARLYLDEGTHCDVYTSSLADVCVTHREDCPIANQCDAIRKPSQPAPGLSLSGHAPATDTSPSPQGSLLIPLLAEGKSLGILHVETTSPAGFSDTAAALLHALATAASNATTNIRLGIAERRRLERLDRFYRLSQALRQASSRDEIIDKTLEASALMVKATHGMVVWPGKAQGSLKIIAAYHLPKELLNVTVREDNSISGMVYRTGEPYLTAATQDDPLSHPAGLHVLSTVVKHKQAWMYAPIIANNRTLGVIALGAEDGDIFTALDLKLLSTILEIAGSALHRMVSMDQVKEHARQLSILNTISRMLARALDARQACKIVTHSLTQQFHYSLAVISNLDSHTHEVTLEALDGPSSVKWYPGQRMTQENGINSYVFQHGRSYYTNHAAQDRLYDPIPGFTAGSNLCVPVIVDQQVIATIDVEEPFEDAFQQSDVDLVDTLAAQLGVTLSNIRRFHTMQVSAERMAHIDRAMRQMTAQTDPHNLAQIILQTAAGLAPFKSGCLFLVNDEGTLKPFATQNIAPEILSELEAQPFTLRDDVYAQQRHPLETAGPNADSHKEHDWRHTWPMTYSVPLIAGQRILAMLDTDAAPPDEEARALLTSFCDRAALALQNAFLYAETLALSQQRATLLTLATKLSSATDDATLHDIIFTSTQRALGAEIITLILLNEDQRAGDVAAYYVRGHVEESSSQNGDLRVQLTPLIQQALALHTPMSVSLANAANLSPEALNFLKLENVQAVLLAPLTVNGQTMGVLAACEHTSARVYTQQDMNMLQGIADQAAMALQRAQLFDHYRHHAEELGERVRVRTAELQAERDRTQAILDAAGEGIVMRDLQGRFLYVNARAKQITDMIEANRVIPDANYWGGRENLTASEQRSLSDIPLHSRKVEELALQKEDGSVIHISMTMTPVPGPEGKPIGIVGVFQDVTRLKELDRMKSVFVSNVSHELRTPITSLKLYLELLPKASHEKRTRYLDTLSRETQRLESMVEDLLVISRLDLGTTRPKIEPVNLCKLVTQIIDDRRLLAEQKKLSLTLDCAPGVPLVAADEHFIVQIVSNLLINAFNYTPPGGQVGVSIAYDAERKVRPVSLSISDNGPGFLADELPHLFERFYRGSAGLLSQAPGTGLGLAIVKELVDRLTGQISVNSVAGQGATMTVTLPVAQSAGGSRHTHPMGEQTR